MNPFQRMAHYLKNRPAIQFKLLTKIGNQLAPQYKFKWPQMAWWDQDEFGDFLELFDESADWNADRRWMIAQLTRLVGHLPGDTAECGVYRGAASWLICHSNAHSQFPDRMHFLFDSFEGLSKPGDSDGEHWQGGELSCSVDQVSANLSQWPNKECLKGWIPDRFEEVSDRQFCFVHIDVDLFQPTLDSIAFFYDRLVPGAVLVCDDYGFTTCPGATEAIDQFLVDKPEQMVSLSGGGGFFIKGIPTQSSRWPL
ncbi:TylF/MycF/NovP-related O-methyltransferase [Pontibacter sp. G13]|uniref:TylF/MycF/NovP-related O-methyltransferase n=1 Tax=Pontibacter sp. G13 TaxID=3074898 RepID=UPI00288A7B26|nr:TylF/MycF/NovP-related O-methyltransferase [Pontibacter sp. G13]WNJ16894.1 TylF/MycF/NovP-related O-methyltransferase [Pontibacter sp. G13]